MIDKVLGIQNSRYEQSRKAVSLQETTVRNLVKDLQVSKESFERQKTENNKRKEAMFEDLSSTTVSTRELEDYNAAISKLKLELNTLEAKIQAKSAVLKEEEDRLSKAYVVRQKAYTKYQKFDYLNSLRITENSRLENAKEELELEEINDMICAQQQPTNQAW